MNIFLIAVVILAILAILDLIVGVSNDAVNFLNSSIGSRVAPHYVIMIVASLGMLTGVTFSSGMMEVARKGIFHPKFFVMPELILIFLAVMLTDILLLDLFNTFGLPTSTTVSIVFELLGAAVAVSIFKIRAAGNSLTDVFNYINTEKAVIIISGILLSVVISFFFGAIIQFITRLIFTFDYAERIKKYGAFWGGITLSVITYFILIKGSKGASFLTKESVVWIQTHTWTLLLLNFVLFSIIFYLLIMFTKINILKPIVLVGTFALAMAFAANDLVNFVGVPLAGLHAFKVAFATDSPLTIYMTALQKPVQSNTYLLLLAGVIMVVTLWLSKKARTVTETEISLGRQEEGMERFGSSMIARGVVRSFHGLFNSVRKVTPWPIQRFVNQRLQMKPAEVETNLNEPRPYFDMLRASVNLMVASAVVSFATSMKLPLSTTYVTFMVAMGTSLSDLAWGRDSAVYRINGVLTVIGGWFFTAFTAFTVAAIYATLLYQFEIFAILGLLMLSAFVLIHTYHFHFKQEQTSQTNATFRLKDDVKDEEAVMACFDQTGNFLKEVSDNLDNCIEAVTFQDRSRLKTSRNESEKIQTWADIIVENIFKTLSIIDHNTNLNISEYTNIIRALQNISETHADIVKRVQEHVFNLHIEFLDEQKEELKKLKTLTTRLLWNTSIMMLRNKRVDLNYIENQCQRLMNTARECSQKQVRRIQEGRSRPRLNILYHRLLENCIEIAENTKALLYTFNASFNRLEKNTCSIEKNK